MCRRSRPREGVPALTQGELLGLVNELRLADGDSAHIEAKRARGGLPRRLWETLSALSNSAGGGVVALGLDGEHGFEVTGVDDPQKVQQDLASLCDQMEPVLRPHVEVHVLEGKPVVTAEVAEIRVEQKPCYYKGAGMTNGAFIRVADGDRRLTPYEVQVMLASRGQPREDEAAVLEASEADLDSDLVAAFVQRLHRDEGSPLRLASDHEILELARVVVRREDGWLPSVGGLLALGRYPQRFFPTLDLTFVVYPALQIGIPGPGGERFLDNRRIDGPIPAMVVKALEALKRNMKRRAIVHGAFREDVWEYPEEALREALVNALVHRDYSPTARGTPVQVHMFPDRLVITNPGGLFGPVTVDRLGESGVSAARNQTLMRTLEDLPVAGGQRTLCENRGSGVGAMKASLRRASLSAPVFDNTIAAFRVTFPNHALLDTETADWLTRFAHLRLSDEQRLALAQVYRRGELAARDYRLLTGSDSHAAARELRELVEQGVIEAFGSGRWTVYRLTGRGDALPQPRRRLDRGPDIVAALRARGELTRKELAVRIGVTDAAAGKWLKRLRDGGVIESTAPSRSPAVKYRLRDPGDPPRT